MKTIEQLEAQLQKTIEKSKARKKALKDLQRAYKINYDLLMTTLQSSTYYKEQMLQYKKLFDETRKKLPWWMKT